MNIVNKRNLIKTFYTHNINIWRFWLACMKEIDKKKTDDIIKYKKLQNIIDLPKVGPRLTT